MQFGAIECLLFFTRGRDQERSAKRNKSSQNQYNLIAHHFHYTNSQRRARSAQVPRAIEHEDEDEDGAKRRTERRLNKFMMPG